ncbi:MAG TPA: TetR/AcrR family transcriptional regulator [Pantanalinema sp.]
MAPRTSEQNREIREQRMAQILQATLELYGAKGYEGTEIGEIAEAAGLARGLVYYYFKDKQTLFRRLFEHLIHHARGYSETALFTEQPRLERLRGFTEFFARSAIDNPHYFLCYARMHHDFVAVGGPREGDAPFADFENRFEKALAQFIAEGTSAGIFRQGPPELLASIYWHAVIGAMSFLVKLQASPEAKRQHLPVIIERCTSLLIA